MKKWFWVLGIALLAGGIVSLSWAFPSQRDFHFWKSEKVVEKLALTDEQIKRLGKIEYEFQKARIDPEARIKSARLTLEHYLSGDEIPKGKLKKLVEEISQAHKEQVEISLKKRISIRRVLAAEQWSELENQKMRLARKIREKRKGRPRPDRPRPGRGGAPESAPAPGPEGEF